MSDTTPATAADGRVPGLGGGPTAGWCQYDPAEATQWLSSPSPVEPELTLADDFGIDGYPADEKYFAAAMAGLVDLAQQAGVFGVPNHHIALWQVVDNRPSVDSQPGVGGHLVTIDAPDGRRFASPVLRTHDLLDPDQHDLDAAVGVLGSTAAVVNSVLEQSYYGPAATAGTPRSRAKGDTTSPAAPGQGLPRRAPADRWHEQVRQKASELVAAGQYPNQAQAFPAAVRQVTDRQRQAVEDKVVAAAARLDPADTSIEARLLRETAASIGDHRSDATRRPTPPAAGDPARLASASFATPAGSAAAGAGAAGAVGSAGPAAPAVTAAVAAASQTNDATPKRRSR